MHYGIHIAARKATWKSHYGITADISIGYPIMPEITHYEWQRCSPSTFYLLRIVCICYCESFHVGFWCVLEASFLRIQALYQYMGPMLDSVFNIPRGSHSPANLGNFVGGQKKMTFIVQIV